MEVAADLIVEYLHDAGDLGRLACVSRACCAAAANATRVTVTVEKHLAGAIRLLRASLRTLRIALSEDGKLTCIDAADIDNLDALPSGMVAVHIEEATHIDWNHGQNYDAVFAGYRALVAKPAVRELRIANFSVCYNDDDAGEIACNPKVVLCDVLTIVGVADTEDDAFVTDLTRHRGVKTLIVGNISEGGDEDEDIMNPLLFATTSARHVAVKANVKTTPACAQALSSNPSVKELSCEVDDASDLLRAATLLSQPHDYADGVIIYRGFEDTGDDAMPEPDIRMLAKAFASPGLIVGQLLCVDTRFAVSDDGLLASLASCACRSATMRRLSVSINGTPELGDGVRALLRLPEHIARVDIDWTDDVDFHDRCNDWMPDALAHVDLPGVTSLSITGHGSPNGTIEWRAAGRALATSAPRLEKLFMYFDYDSDDDEVNDNDRVEGDDEEASVNHERWREQLEEGYAEACGRPVPWLGDAGKKWRPGLL